MANQEANNYNADRECFITLKRWLENRNAGKTFEGYFLEYGYQKIAIYGAGDLGKLLYEELKNSVIEVVYFVDRNGEGLKQVNGIPVVLPEEIGQQKAVDGMIVTPIGSYMAICEMLVQNYPELPLLSLKDAVYEM